MKAEERLIEAEEEKAVLAAMKAKAEEQARLNMRFAARMRMCTHAVFYLL